MLQVLKTNWHDFVEIRWDTRQQPALRQTREFGVQNGPYGAYLTLKARTQIRLPTGPIPRIPLDASLWGSLQIFSDVELNVMHRAILIHGRDSRIARLLRGDSLSKIEKAMRLGFDTFRRNVNWQMAIKKKCHMVALHALHTHLRDDVPELRKKIVHLALFR